MDYTIVEPCPECGAVPNKFTATQDEDDCTTWLHIECPKCGWAPKSKYTNANMALCNWNDSAVNRRIEKTVKPCPFCGNGDLALDYDYGSCFVVCKKCRCRSAMCDTKEHALEAWNRRPDKDA